MAGKRRDLRKVEGRNVVERLPKGRSRLHGDIIPAFMAWLRVQSRRYQRIRDALARPSVRQAVSGGEGTYWKAIDSLNTIQTLCINLTQTFDTKDWREEIEAVGEALGWGKPSWCEIPLVYPTPSLPGKE